MGPKSVTGWIRGDKAKTVEDMEKLATLQEQVAKLSTENKLLQDHLTKAQQLSSQIESLSTQAKIILKMAATSALGSMSREWTRSGGMRFFVAGNEYATTDPREAAKFEAARKTLINLGLIETVAGNDGWLRPTAAGYEKADEVGIDFPPPGPKK